MYNFDMKIVDLKKILTEARKQCWKLAINFIRLKDFANKKFSWLKGLIKDNDHLTCYLNAYYLIVFIKLSNKFTVQRSQLNKLQDNFDQ
ncbi:hypothetical protein BpHYR1_026444 [Brachionus plicatilis]|uniref:Uncharacterized protein n=1 Tax=Brachionus plicatilis TaxID=10195 RepID=A0A3M7S8E5_BRAPC|nr:hypothetical protein BpHYR1_026444 [Brachionus plicatilis]